jgi:dephospho-CoA kinase
MSKPLLVGLTGGIGSGKSTIAKVFKSLGIPVFNSDVVAKSIINKDAEVIDSITTQFGDVYKNGELDKIMMASIVFTNDKALIELNNIVHPKVAEYFENWVKQNKIERILIKEAAILIESGAYKQMDKIIAVNAPVELRIQRVVSRDNSSIEKVISRINTQLSDEDRGEFADYSIDNGGVELVIPQVLEVYERLKMVNKIIHNKNL